MRATSIGCVRSCTHRIWPIDLHAGDAADDFGTVAPGRRADLVLLNANPLEDVANFADRAGVMVHGKWIPEEEIQARLAEIEAAVAPPAPATGTG